MEQRCIYILLVVICISLSASTAHPTKPPSTGWTTEDETLIEKEWMLFPDDKGKVFNISLKSEDNMYRQYGRDIADEVSFWLYTRKNIDLPQNLILNDVNSLDISNFDGTVNTKVIIHGWKNNKNSAVNSRLVKAYLPTWDVNVIVVDWGSIAKSINYYLVRSYAYDVGKIVADFLNFLVRVGKSNLTQVHIIGHSLGAHVAGYAGSEIGEGIISAITGLDPALPLFSIKDPDNRLDETDAAYVEIIHTDAGRLGFALPLGHVDFYPNKGVKQPGCGIDIVGTCGHSRSVIYFEESLKYNEGFLGKPCESYKDVKNGKCSDEGPELRMGGKKPKYGSRGQYLLKTAAKEPYGHIEEKKN